MTVERPCDCAGHHMRFPDRSPEAITYELLHPPTRPRLSRPIPAMHQHEDELCSERHLGIGGCPGLPHCRDWIVGTYRMRERLAKITGDGSLAFELRIRREELERWFAHRSPLSAPAA